MAATSCRGLSRQTLSVIKSTVSRPSIAKPASPSSSFGIPNKTSTSTLSRPLPQMGCLLSLLPLHTAVSSARLTSCLGLDSECRSLSQELGLSVPR